MHIMNNSHYLEGRVKSKASFPTSSQVLGYNCSLLSSMHYITSALLVQTFPRIILIMKYLLGPFYVSGTRPDTGDDMISTETQSLASGSLPSGEERSQ